MSEKGRDAVDEALNNIREGLAQIRNNGTENDNSLFQDSGIQLLIIVDTTIHSNRK